MLLTDVWLNDAADPSDRLPLQTVGDVYQVTATLGGGVETGYASGRSRLWSTEDDSSQWALTVLAATEEQIAWLVAHRGRVVCVRDLRGRKFFGAYQAVPVEVPTGDDALSLSQQAVSLSLTSVTFDEAV